MDEMPMAMLTNFQKTPKQIEAARLQASQATYILLSGGSRSGKTFHNVRSTIIRALKAPGSRHLMARKHFNHIKQSIYYDTWKKVMKICFPQLVLGVDYHENKSDWFIKFNNGSEIWFGGLDSGERLEKILGNEYCTIYINEVSEIDWYSVEMLKSRLAQKVVYENSSGQEVELSMKMYFDCNPPSKRHWTYKVFCQFKHPTDAAKTLDKEDYVWLLMNPEDNKANITQGYVEKILGSLSKRSQQRFKDGMWTDDDENALWKSDNLDANRIHMVDFPEEIKSIVVAVDPAGSVKDGADETGIIVNAIDYNGHAYTLEDVTGKYKPSEWGKKAVAMYEKWEANCIVAEKNYGGEMVANTITTINQNVPVKLVTATRGKALRADPIVSLYEQGKVHHVGHLSALEDEMCTWTPDNKTSPNRLDANVWGLTWLFFGDKIISEVHFC